MEIIISCCLTMKIKKASRSLLKTVWLLQSVSVFGVRAWRGLNLQKSVSYKPLKFS